MDPFRTIPFGKPLGASDRSRYRTTVTAQLGHFELPVLARALEDERLSRRVTWKQVMDEINAPFRTMPQDSIPISLSAVRGMASKGSANSTIVLQVLLWLGRTPESFIRDAAAAGELLTSPGPGLILRFDSTLIHAALDGRRAERGVTWRQVAAEMGPRFNAPILTKLAQPTAVGFPQVMTMTQWLGEPAARFTRGFPR